MATKKKHRQIFLVNRKSRKQKRVETDPQNSKHKGIAGIYELLLRRFKTVVYSMTILPLYVLGCAMIGLAVVPGVAVYHLIITATASSSLFVQYLGVGMSIASGFMMFGVSLVFIVPTVNFILHTTPKVFRGPYYSVDFLQWFVHNALIYLVRYTFLEFITPSPLNILFFKMMGMKIGNGVQINSSNISDAALISLGDFVTVGGSATLCAHYGQDGYLVLAPVVIGNKVTLGLKSSVMGGVTMGDGSKLLPHSVALPKTIIGPGEIWGGVPAVKLK